MVHNVLQYLADARRARPDAQAVSDCGGSVTYAELYGRVCAVGAALSGVLGGAKNRPVFVCIGRGLDSVTAFLGVAASGNFYVPIDPSLPEQRLAGIFDTMRPAAYIVTGKMKNEPPFGKCPRIELGEAEKVPAGCGIIEEAIGQSRDTDPLYCIFTSGSTGVPKGVAVSHRSVINMAEQFTSVFGFGPDTIFGNQAPFDFDVSVKDIYISLKNAASVHILETSLFMMPKRLMERLNERKVNTVIWAASAMKIVSALHTFDRIVPEHLKLVMFSGEVLPCKVLNDWAEHIPGAKFVNLYGPTEITCNCTYYKIERRFANDEAIPIGRPFENTDVFLLRGNEAAGEGETGEICVRGSCLALGYYANPEKTAQAFCQNPLQPNYPERIYRTGDLARWRGGVLMYVGRADSQIKHMGHRIELGEIETAANAAGFIAAACCLYDARGEKICLFYQAAEQDDKAVFAWLKKYLPSYMIPNRLVYLEKMPQNRTGKMDRALLREKYITNEVSENG